MFQIYFILANKKNSFLTGIGSQDELTGRFESSTCVCVCMRKLNVMPNLNQATSQYGSKTTNFHVATMTQSSGEKWNFICHVNWHELVALSWDLLGLVYMVRTI